MKRKAANRPSYATYSRNLRQRLLPALIAGLFLPAAQANPSGHQVVAGQASFNQQGSVLSITNSPGAIINWQNFSINAGETTRFIQQSADSSVLNRVIGQDPSQILGTLQSNGRVFLINPNGILFGQGARIDVNGLVASTLNLSNEDFLAGRMKFEGGGVGNLKNEGAITTATGGQVYLIAPNVENTGIITAPNGDIMLAAGHTVHLVDSSNPALQVVLSAPEHEALNIGQIVVQAGKASMVGALVRQRGLVSANSAVVGENGKIVFKASRDTMLEAGSVTTATGGGRGGDIQILGDRVGLMGDAKVDASGVAGGGTVLVGGDYQGGNPAIQNAAMTYLDHNVRVSADATGNGDGGRVIVWADDTTRTYAHISARGGAQGGDGGFVETSGKRYLDVGNAFPDVSAPNGKAGTWLLDPDEISISYNTGSNVTATSPFAPAAIGSSILNVDTLKNYLETNGNALVQTNGSGNGNISVDATINPSLGATGSLELRAAGDINVNYGIGALSGSLNVTLHADSDNSGSGTVNINNLLHSDGGNIDVRGAHVYMGAYGTLVSSTGRMTIEARTAGGSFQADAGSMLNGQALHINADRMTLNGGINVFGSLYDNGGVYLNTYTPGTAISLGTKAVGTLGLSAAELQAIQSPYLRIGGPNNTGGITLNAPVAFSSTSVDTLWLASSGQINIASSLSKTGGIALPELDIHSNGNVTRVASTGIINGWEEVHFNSGTNGSVLLDPGAVVTAGSLGEVEFRTDNLTVNGSVVADLVDIRPYTLGRGITVGSSSCHSSTPNCLSVTRLGNIDARTIGIGHHDEDAPGFASDVGAVHVAGITYGANDALTDRHANTLRIGLLGGGNVTQSGAIDVYELGVVSGGSATLEHSGNRIHGLVGLTNGGNFSFRNGQDLAVTYIYEGDDVYEGIRTNGGAVSLATSAGSIYAWEPIATAGGNITVLSAGDIYGGYLSAGSGNVALSADGEIDTWDVSGNTLTARARAGVYLYNLNVNTVDAVNYDLVGSSDIDIASVRSFTVQQARQAGNAGSIYIGPYSYSASAAAQASSTTLVDGTQLALQSVSVPTEPASSTTDITIGGLVDAGAGDVYIASSGSITSNASGLVRGTTVDLYAHRGISVATQTSELFAENRDSAGTSAINITNTGPLAVQWLKQGVNGGSINLTNYGALTVSADYDDPSNPAVWSAGGAIRLVANSPLTVNGSIGNTSGTVALIANPSASGNDNLVVNGTVTTAGAITLAAGGTVTINGAVSGPYTVQQNIGTISNPSTSPTVGNAINTVTTTINNTTNTITNSTTSQNTVPGTPTSSSPSSTSTSSSTSSTSSSTTEQGTTSDTKQEGEGEQQTQTAQNDSGANKNEPARKLYCN